MIDHVSFFVWTRVHYTLNLSDNPFGNWEQI